MTEKILIEALSRERHQELAQWNLSVMTQGIFNRMDSKVVAKITDIFRNELEKFVFQTVYSSSTRASELAQKLEETKKNLQRMKRLDNMTVK